MLKAFKDFAMRGNVMDMAVGIIIGASFGKIVDSLVNDIIMPPIGMMMGKVDFSNIFITLKEGATAGPYASVAAAKAAGAVTINGGMFINNIISFLIVAFSVFLLINAMNKAYSYNKTAEIATPTKKDCPFCFSAISVKAKRCPNCTSELK